MILSIVELADMVLMVGIIGFLFQGILRAPPRETDAMVRHYRRAPRSASWDDFWWACALIAPGILLHELGHKFTAMSFGQAATFHAACSVSDAATGGFFSSLCVLQLVVIGLKVVGFPFLFFVPAYVSFSSGVAPLAGAAIAIAGPLVHLAFWGGCTLYLRNARRVRHLSARKRLFLAFTARINLFLFIFNILPIPGFDGFQVLRYLWFAVV